MANPVPQTVLADHRFKLVATLAQLRFLSPDTADDLSHELNNWVSDAELVQYLYSKALVTRSQVNQAYARIYRVPYLDLPAQPDLEVMKIIPYDVCAKYAIVAYKKDGKKMSEFIDVVSYISGPNVKES